MAAGAERWSDDGAAMGPWWSVTVLSAWSTSIVVNGYSGQILRLGACDRALSGPLDKVWIKAV